MTRCPVNLGKAKVGRSSDALNSHWTTPQDLMTDVLMRRFLGRIVMPLPGATIWAEKRGSVGETVIH